MAVLFPSDSGNITAGQILARPTGPLALWCFQEQHKELVREALVIAEEMTWDFFRLSRSRWPRAPYDILTLEDLRQEEIHPYALAMVAKYEGYLPGSLLRSGTFDFYRICLQDHNILRVLQDEKQIRPLSLLSYILTHELVHVVRFSLFQARFEATAAEKLAEEGLVHRLTQEILTPLNFLDLPPIISYYNKVWQGGWQYAHL